MRKTNRSTKTIIAPIMNYDYYIGIDCGTKTGFAVWSPNDNCFLSIQSLKIHRALFAVLSLKTKGYKIHVTIEDARKWRYFKEKTAAEQQEREHKKQGAGYVKRDAGIWEDFCYEMNIPFTCVCPDKKITKWNEEKFRLITGYSGKRTTEHGRDAAMLVFDRGSKKTRWASQPTGNSTTKRIN